MDDSSASAKITSRWWTFAPLGLVAFCASCTAAPLDESRPDTPSAFEHAAAASETSWPAKDWYRRFGSTELDALIEQASTGNLDLAAARARIRQADAKARAAGAALLPQVDFNGNATHFRGRAGGHGAQETDASALLSASYEIDFWGKNRAANDAAHSSALASRADRDVLALTTSSSVADTYFQVLSLRERVRLARETLEAARVVLSGIEARVKEGAATELELASQRALVANVELVLAPLEQAEMEARGALAILVGHAPEGFAVSGRELADITEPVVSPGLPVELLTRRPDVLAAEANLQGAHADLAAARAALFPTLTLTASGGVQNPAVQAAVITLEGTGVSFTAAAALVQTIFDGGKRRAVRDEAEARQEELIVNYRGAILAALLDVETALAALDHLRTQTAAQTENVTQSERAFEAARLRYREGSGDFLSVFEAQRTLYAARDQMSQFQLARLQAIVALCKALGGGWQSADLPAAR